MTMPTVNPEEAPPGHYAVQVENKFSCDLQPTCSVCSMFSVFHGCTVKSPHGCCPLDRKDCCRVTFRRKIK